MTQVNIIFGRAGDLALPEPDTIRATALGAGRPVDPLSQLTVLGTRHLTGLLLRGLDHRAGVHVQPRVCATQRGTSHHWTRKGWRQVAQSFLSVCEAGNMIHISYIYP